MIKKHSQRVGSKRVQRLNLRATSKLHLSRPASNEQNQDPEILEEQNKCLLNSHKQNRQANAHLKAKRKMRNTRGSRVLSVAAKTHRKISPSHARKQETKKMVRILEERIEGNRFRKMSEEYMDKLDSQEKIIKHTHSRKVSFEEVAQVRIFNKKDLVMEYKKEYCEDLEG